MINIMKKIIIIIILLLNPLFVNAMDKMEVISKCKKYIRKYKPIIFDENTFSTEDILTIIKIESDFNPNVVGSDNEVGLMQILKPNDIYHPERFSNDFSIEYNIMMGLTILKQKYRHFKNRKDAIIGYNGYIKTKDGVDETYWEKFQENLKLIKRGEY